MESSEALPAWRCSVSLRISHPSLDPDAMSTTLNAMPVIAQSPGDSRVPYGDCKSVGYWCIKHEIEYPDRPDALFLWAEQFVLERETHFRSLLEDKYNINFYIGIHANVITLGFNLPATPVIWRLGIPIGVELFSQ